MSINFYLESSIRHQEITLCFLPPSQTHLYKHQDFLLNERLKSVLEFLPDLWEQQDKKIQRHKFLHRKVL